MRGMRRGLKAGCSSKQEISIRQKGRETKNRQMGKDNCIWGTKECQQLKGRISYPIETNFQFCRLLLLFWLSTLSEVYGSTQSTQNIT